MNLFKNFYELLGLPTDATTEEVRRAYREAARKLHPDTNTTPGDTEFFLNVQEAYEVLSDAERRSTYDAALPKEAQTIPEISVRTYYSRPLLPRLDEPQLLYALVEMNAQPSASHAKVHPLNVCLVLDCSTSMQGPVMDTVKATAVELVRQMRPEDSFSLVSFSDRAEVVVPASMRMDRATIETSIRMLRTGGGTEIYRGLEAGYKEISSNLRKGYVNHILLLTDGRTYGDEDTCLRLADRAVEQGIGISAFGIGSQWNDLFLDALASRTGGTSMYISKPKDIRQFLIDKFSGLGKSYADRVTYQMELSPYARLNYIIRLEPDSAVLETQPPVHFGSLPNQGTMSILMEFVINEFPTDLENLVVAEGLLALDIPSRTVALRSYRMLIERPVGEQVQEEAPPGKVMQAVSRLTLYRMQERVRQDLDDGNVNDATRRLQYLATHLLAKGEHDLAHTVMREAESIQHQQGLSEEGKKSIKYGTRSLLLPAPRRTTSGFLVDKNGMS